MGSRRITIRQLDRMQTFWHLCWLGCVDVAIVLAIQVLKEHIEEGRRYLQAALSRL